MFGRRWTNGSAKVLRRQLLSTGKDGYKFFEYLVEVSPGGGLESFQTTLKDPVNAIKWRQPRPNDMVKVHCDPAKQQAKWDRSDPKLQQEVPRGGGTIGPGGAPDWF